MDKKTLGILGGMGPMASSLLYEIITKSTKASCDQEHLEIFLYSCPSIPDRSQAIQSGHTEAVLTKLINGLKTLEQMGAEVLAVPCNTSHYFYQDMAQAVSVPLLDMVSLTVQKALENRPKKVAILATEGTNYGRLYQNKFSDKNIPVFELPCHLQERVNQLIYQEIKANKPPSVENFQEIEAYLLGQEVDCILLACTELSIYAKEHPLSSLYLDALDILCREAILSCGGAFQDNKQ
ncbi:MAG: amino acid racemase [Eubacteriales bacterium]